MKWVMSMVSLILMMNSGIGEMEELDREIPGLQEIMSKIDERSRYYEIEIEQLNEAIGREGVAKSYKLPRVSGHYRVGGVIEDREDLKKTKKSGLHNADVMVTQPIFQWGKLDASEKIGRIERAVAEKRKQWRLEDLRDSVRVGYVNVLLYKARLGIAKSRLEYLRKRDLVWELEVEFNSVTESKAERNKVLIAEAELKIKQLELIFERERGNLELLCGQAVDLEGDEIRVDELVRILKGLLDEEDKGIGLMKQNLEILEKQMEIEEQNYIAIAAETKPSLNLFGSFYQDKIESSSSTKSVYRNNYAAGLQVNWNIFDGFKTKNLKIENKAKQRRLSHEWEIVRAREGLNNRLRVTEKNLRMEEIGIQWKQCILNEKEIGYLEKMEKERGIADSELLRKKIDLAEDKIRLCESMLGHLQNKNRGK
jgi:outer membrane protein TolC